MTFTLLFLTLLTFAQTLQQTNNNFQHSINGNHTLKLMQWNKGKALFHNKINCLDQLISNHSPHII